jgi:hypothetical protein
MNIKLIKDRTALILVGLAFSALCLCLVRLLGEYSYGLIFGASWFATILDNNRLRKKLKDLGYPDDLASRIQRKNS